MYYVYIMTNKINTVLYIGVTSNIAGRVQQHKQKQFSGFTQQYNINKLVYYEEYQYVYDAIAREKKLKNWHRQWKINQITKINPCWHDISENWNETLK